MIRLAGETADGVLLNTATPSYLRRAVEEAHEGKTSSNKPTQSFDVAAYIDAVIDDDRSVALRAAKKHIAHKTFSPLYRTLLRRVGFVEEVDYLEKA